MRTVNGNFQDILVQVRADTNTGESVFISGNTKELGEWKVSQAVQLNKLYPEGNIWQGVVSVPSQQNLQYRYLVCAVVENEGKYENVVRHWESHLKPRILRPMECNENKCDLDTFGFQDDVESIAKGWLTSETVVQFKMYNSPVTIWKRRYREKPISLHVTTIDITRKDSVTEMIGLEEDSTLTERPAESWPIVEVAKMNDCNWEFCKQTQFGIMYDPGEYVIFQVQMLKPESIAYMVDFYVHDSEVPEHIGFCYILPSNMRDTSGTCNMPISGKRQQPIGQLSVDYLIIRPMKDFVCDLSVTYAKHWKTIDKKHLDVGHRGAGNARRNDKVENVLENTVASFNYAAKHGADMVELDVQLSKDLVPVIYHDYYICISMKKKRSTNEHELLQLAVKDLTAQQLRMLKLSPAVADLAKLQFHEDDSDDNQPFPTLKHVLEAVDPSVGVNIEIKCPMQYHDGTWELDIRFEMNSYVDIILRDILEYAGNRFILLSCFHPDICTMVRLKQNKYPLLFLTQGETIKYPPYLDTRTASIPMATHFALNTGLLGIDVHAEDLIRDPSHIPFVKDHNLILFCWGDDINHSDVIRSLKEQGVDGVIYDKVDEFTRAQENVFLVEAKARMGLLELAGQAADNLSTWSSTSTN
ncbi:hypothetical protein JTE90_021266 [Oedothorax gibbosus]|uniref:Glycerophosphocholine phosphodiesterase GPCPD1 n=1 Tax=Oedothorax gibbosus TaxID=931172 RepID=A0AAV6TZ49_9ARAC|nr:hypothetical protein JTE90_021266 [Oedothorax gibbosus]